MSRNLTDDELDMWAATEARRKAAESKHDPEDFINPVGFGRALGGFLLIVLAVASCAALGIYLAGKQ